MWQGGSFLLYSKAFKNRRRIYVLREGEIFPLLLSLPTGSLKELTKYLKRLLSKGRKSNSVVTRFSLKKATNSGGLAYSQAQFAVDRVLTPEEHALVERMTEQVKTYSKNVGFEYDNVVDEGLEDINVDPETGEIIEPLKRLRLVMLMCGLNVKMKSLTLIIKRYTPQTRTRRQENRRKNQRKKATIWSYEALNFLYRCKNPYYSLRDVPPFFHHTIQSVCIKENVRFICRWNFHHDFSTILFYNVCDKQGKSP